MCKLDEFTTAYLVAALWSTNDESTPQGGEPMDHNYSISDIDGDALRKAVEDCAAFRARFGHLLKASGLSDESAGHDFWLTRNGHGAGYWDRGLGAVGEQLADAARSFKEVDLYVGDDGKIHA